jgi:hypothetical protein
MKPSRLIAAPLSPVGASTTREWFFQGFFFQGFFFQGVRSLDFFLEFKGSDPLKKDPLKKDPLKKEPLKKDPLKKPGEALKRTVPHP